MAITILHWNARSIFKKLPELKQYLAGLTMLPDVICIQETHLTPKYHPVFQNYTILRQNRPPFRGKGGGLLICIKTSLEFSEVNLSGPSTRMEVLGVTVGGYAIFNVYNPPSHYMQTENLFFSQDLEKLSCVATSTLTMVCGAVSVQIITAVFYFLFSKPMTLSF